VDYFYVISPVAADPDFEEKRAIVAGIARSLNLVPLFPLDRAPGIALERAGDDIRKARFVLADLSLERPSCYFELGLAEATGVDVNIIAKAGTPIHQVGYAAQVNFYRDLDVYKRMIRRLFDAKFAPRVAEAAEHVPH
jgi:hypothetical protein